jgi:hypothetical protein
MAVHALHLEVKHNQIGVLGPSSSNRPAPLEVVRTLRTPRTERYRESSRRKDSSSSTTTTSLLLKALFQKRLRMPLAATALRQIRVGPCGGHTVRKEGGKL